MLHKLEYAPGSIKPRKRKGRGPGSTMGKTSGRGHNGQKARSGGGIRIGFEGGQMPLHRRLPKRGFTNIFKKEFSIVNLEALLRSTKLDLTKPINKQALLDANLINTMKKPVKILATGELDQALHIEVEKYTKNAEAKIINAGGKVVRV